MLEDLFEVIELVPTSSSSGPDPPSSGSNRPEPKKETAHLLIYCIIGGFVCLAVSILVPVLIWRKNSNNRILRDITRDKDLVESWDKTENLTDVDIDDYRNYVDNDNTMQITLDYDSDSVNDGISTEKPYQIAV